MASNSAPDACQEILKAFAEGVTERENEALPVHRPDGPRKRDEVFRRGDRRKAVRRDEEEEKGEAPLKASAARVVPAVAHGRVGPVSK